MKKTVLTIITLMSIISANAQIAYDSLDINNVKAQISAAGDLFWNSSTSVFEVPKNSGKSTIFAGNLWIGGYDAGGQLKMAGQTYRQYGTDFFNGPLNSNGTYDSTYAASMNKVWKINKCDIDAYINWINSGGAIGPNPVSATVMDLINNWPVQNQNGQALAPYVDYNNNGIYDPDYGDYPKIKGDQALFFVYNDKGGLHSETGAAAIGIEIQGMAYAYNCVNDSALYNTIFINYKIINKSGFRLDSVFIGNWTDFDIGNSADDFVSCDVTRGCYYGYNGATSDGIYGANPPAQAVVFLGGPFANPNGLDDPQSSTPNGTNYGDGTIDNERLGMSRFMYYGNTTNSVNGNPTPGDDSYQYMAGTWKNGAPWKYGGTAISGSVVCNYIYPGASDPLGYGTNMIPKPTWDEFTAGNVPGERRGMGSFGPFTLQPGAIENLDFAYVYGRATSGGNLASVTVMKNRVDSVRTKFKNGITACGCSGSNGINELTENNLLKIYPNPSTDYITIDFKSSNKNYSIKIYDVLGQLVKQAESINSTTLNINDLKKGIYLLNVIDGDRSFIQRFIKQ